MIIVHQFLGVYAGSLCAIELFLKYDYWLEALNGQAPKNWIFGFLWIWPESTRGRQREENFQKTSWKAKKKFLHDLAAVIVSSTLRQFHCFYLMYT